MNYFHNKAPSQRFDMILVTSGLRRFLATENPLNMMKNVFCFAVKVFIVLKRFKFLF